MSFADFFQAATGYAPFPWQSRLYAKFTDGTYPTAANIPTGLGKTSVVAIWLIALAFHPELDEDERVHREFLRMCEGK